MPTTKKKIRTIAITTGDTDGIGLEVTLKALAKIGPQASARFVIWRAHQSPKKDFQKIDDCFERVTVSDFDPQQVRKLNSRQLLDVASSLPPPLWFYHAAKLALSGDIQGLVTGPMSKSLIQSVGFPHIGHTELLAQICGIKHLFMAFIGSEFNVVIVTGHIALQRVASSCRPELIKEALLAANKLRPRLAEKFRRRPLGLVGLNPHAGEGGLIGHEEKKLAKICSDLQKQGLNLDGPLVPDAAFLPQVRKKYSILVCPYHDQGLIPFKAVHGQEMGIHLTLGLPFLRASVDHGTAKNIFRKNKANPGSMIDALKYALREGK